MKMCIFKKLKANRVNLWHTCYLGVLKDAAFESAVCPAQKWLISHTNLFKMAATAVLKFVNVHIVFTKHGRNMNEVCFCMFSNRNPMPYSEV